MRAGARKESAGSRGGTAWNDGVHSVDGGSTGELSSVVTTAQDTDASAVTTFGGGADALGKTAWFAPVEDSSECKDGVCPVPWLSTSTFLSQDRDSNFPAENTIQFAPKVKEDLVNHPSHYTDGGIETIDAIEAQLSEEEYEGYLRGNCVKYLWRWKNKGGVTDLKKCRWYLDKLIQIRENTSH